MSSHLPYTRLGLTNTDGRSTCRPVRTRPRRVRPIWDDIERKVLALIDELTPSPPYRVAPESGGAIGVPVGTTRNATW